MNQTITKHSPDTLKQNRIDELKEIEKSLVNEWECTFIDNRPNIQQQIKDNFDEQMDLILSFNPPLQFLK